MKNTPVPTSRRCATCQSGCRRQQPTRRAGAWAARRYRILFARTATRRRCATAGGVPIPHDPTEPNHECGVDRPEHCPQRSRRRADGGQLTDRLIGGAVAVPSQSDEERHRDVEDAGQNPAGEQRRAARSSQCADARPRTPSAVLDRGQTVRPRLPVPCPKRVHPLCRRGPNI